MVELLIITLSIFRVYEIFIKIIKAVEIWHEEYMSIFNHSLLIHFA